MPALFDHLLESMDLVAKIALDEVGRSGVASLAPGLSEAKASADKDPVHHKFSELIRVNHSLLRAIGVSHPALESIVQLGELHGCPTKLTGAGGGGCAFSLVVPSISDTAKFQETLSSSGYHSVLTKVGGCGVLLYR